MMKSIENSKKRMQQCIICVGVLCVIWGVYLLMMKIIEKRIEIQHGLSTWVHQVENIEIKENELSLEGFAFFVGKHAKFNTYEIVLREIESDKLIFPKMEYSKREDVNRYFLCDMDYTDSGYLAKFRINKQDMKEKSYELVFRVLGKKTAYHTGVYLSEGELVYADPLEYKKLDVLGTDLEEIVRQGILRVYRPDVGMYVYQYKGELYWIAESGYDFSGEGDTIIQWHIETTQIEKLPKERLENQWLFDNLGFSFKEMEILNINTGKYRVAKRRIPDSYSISVMNTGKYVDDWVWIQSFRPYYEFGK